LSTLACFHRLQPREGAAHPQLGTGGHPGQSAITCLRQVAESRPNLSISQRRALGGSPPEPGCGQTPAGYASAAVR